MGWLTFEDVVAWSRNVGAARVALDLGATTDESSALLYATWAKFGFGARTGIDLAGEVGGLVRDPSVVSWREIDLANGSFGQGVAVTEMQLATAYAAMVNGGTLVRPHVVAGIGDEQVAPAARAEGLRQRIPVALADRLDAARRDRGAVLPRPDAGARLRRRRQDGHGPDLGQHAERRCRRLEGQQVQLLVRRVHRPLGTRG